MAANEETVSIDTVKKTLWDSLEALGENISGDTLTALMEIIEGGGNAKLIVTLTEGEDDKITADKTRAEIKEAFDAGNDVILLKDGDTRLRVQMVNENGIISEMINVFNDNTVIGIWYAEADGSWTEHMELRTIEAGSGGD